MSSRNPDTAVVYIAATLLFIVIMFTVFYSVGWIA